jgi:glucan 1,3-beta-glucosidase
MEQPPAGARPISTAASIASVLDTHLAIPDEITEISAPIRPFVSDEHPPSEATTPRDSYAPSSANNSSPLIPLAQKEEQDPNDAREDLTEAKKKPSLFRRSFLLPIALLVLIVIILAIVLPVYYTVVKPNKGKNGSKLGSGPASPKSTGGPGKNPGSPSGATSGGNGSVVVTEDGTSFVYSNPFGGYWVSDPNNPFNNSARPNSWTPPLDTPWTFGKDKIYGVNLGGLFVLEPFITPALRGKHWKPVAAECLYSARALEGSRSERMFFLVARPDQRTCYL